MKDSPKKKIQKSKKRKASPKVTTISFLVGGLIGILILIVLLIFYNRKNSSLTEKELNSFITSTPAPYPFFTSDTDPKITADSAIIMDEASQVVLYSKNADKSFSMASTTKIMTALVALDYYKDNDILTVKQVALPGWSAVGLRLGERMRFVDLLYGMMLPSGDDAALAIAQNYPGGQKAFVEKMNEKAQGLHLYNTHYSDPVGLDDSGDYTTVTDLARLTTVAMSNADFATVVGTKEKVISDAYTGLRYDLVNINELLGVDGITGVKTGYTDKAKGILVTTREQDGHTIIIVVMRSEDRFIDTEKLLALLPSVTYLSFHQ